jgi:antitoxin component of MazEF toxin-antitoxin module
MELSAINMPIEFEIKINRVHGSLRMTIPKEVAKALSVKEGDVVLVGITDSTMSVRKRTR